MDHDMAVFCDMAEYFREDFEGNLLMGRLFGEGNTLGLQMQQRGGLPDTWKHAEDHPYFFMGPMMNLAAMREAGTWEKLLRAHREIGQEEQLSLTAACDGRVRGVDKKWNLVPQWDHLGEASSQITGEGLEEYAGVTWHNGVPLGLIHWSEWAKPWHYQSTVWRADVWQSERTTWGQLEHGSWDKPLAVLIRCNDRHVVTSLFARGWRVKVFDFQKDETLETSEFPISPDLEFLRMEELEQDAVSHAEILRVSDIDVLSAEVLEILSNAHALALVGPVSLETMDSLDIGGDVCFLQRFAWPAGGPNVRILDYNASLPPTVGREEDLFVNLDALAKKKNGNSASDGVSVSRAGTAAEKNLSVGVMVIATGKYDRFVDPLINSMRRHLLPGYAKTYYVFSDKSFTGEDLVWVETEHRDWPAPALYQYEMILDQRSSLERHDFLLFSDANMLFVDDVREEIIGDLIAVKHPGFADKTREEFTYETRRASTACILPGEGSAYYSGAIQGGTPACYLAAAAQLAANTRKDDERGITAIWHDESHWNRYLVDQPPTVELSPAYCSIYQCLGSGAKITIVPEDYSIVRAPA